MDGGPFSSYGTGLTPQPQSQVLVDCCISIVFKILEL